MRKIINFNHWSITRKMIAINILVVALALSICAAAFMIVDSQANRERVVKELIVQADIVAYNVSAPLLFDDKDGAISILNALKTISVIDLGAVYDVEQRLFVKYVAARDAEVIPASPYVYEDQLIWPENKIDRVIFERDRVHLLHPIHLADEFVGNIYLQGNLSAYHEYRRKLWVIVFGVFFVSLAIAIAIMFPAHRVISNPILSLSDAIKQVTYENNYSVRATKVSEDELGLLTDGFNQMLIEIERREDELKRYQEKLENEVELRTSDLKSANKELESTVVALKAANNAIRVSEENKRVAEESTKAKSLFLANMSHELRTPMNGVLGMLALMRETGLSREQLHYLDVAYDSGAILLELLNDILDLSKIEEGKLDLEIIDFNLCETVDEVFGLLGESCYAKEVELVSYRKSEVPSIVGGDPVRFKQVVYNIIGNAIKFTTKGYIRFTYDIVKAYENGVKMRFEITDTGIGIKKEALEIIFETFSQADTSTTRKYGGTGLGLSLCQQLTSLMGGEIGVESEYGKGSTFWFTVFFDLPANTDEPVRPEFDGFKQLLLIDDQTVSINSLGQYLEHLSIEYESLTSERGLAQKLEVADVDRYSALIIDFGMPGVNVNGLIEAIRKTRFNRLPIVFMGSLAQRNELNFKLGYKSELYLIKPFRVRNIVEVLNSIQSHEDGVALPDINQRRDRRVLGDRRNAAGQGEERRAEDSAPDVNAALESEIAEEKASLSVLLVEDNHVNQKVAVQRLTKIGCEVLVSENGQLCLELLKENNFDFDIIFMDCHMPVMDGYATTIKIREHEAETQAESPLIIVAMTANAMEGDRERCLEVGMNDYIAKPVKQEDLVQMIDRWVGGGARKR